MSEPRREFLKKVSWGQGIHVSTYGVDEQRHWDWDQEEMGWNGKGKAFCCCVEDVLRCRSAGWCAVEALCSALHDSQARFNY